MWFVLIGAGGAIIEMILVNFNGSWSYSNQQFFGIPFWIPFYWGNLSTTLVVMYEGLINKNHD